MGRKYDASIQTRIDCSFRVITDDDTELPTSRGHSFPFDSECDRLIIVPEVRDVCTGPEIHILPEDAITDIREMWDARPLHQYAVFDLDTLPDLGIALE